MMDILVATTNQGKIKEIQKIFKESLPQIRLLSLAECGITLESPETGSTFTANALQKALFYSKQVKGTVTIGEDSGLAVEALDGAPGVFSARYAGEPKSDERNIDKVLMELENRENKNAKFVTAVALCLNGAEVISFSGEVHGVIIEERRGNSGFGYDPVFYYPPYEKTFGQLTTAEKNRISHRANAFKKLKEYLISNQP
ncbi:MAG: RdgB/HAM1 family non-canonical purine NTP pyrophosphatase [bacterium]|nr:RdgB/HAM1 family non-canonical purine NTP pyrophosphatase [bacterium]